MPFPEAATLFSRSRESGPPPGEPDFPGPAEYGPCLQILKAMNRIMAEHFGIPPGPKEKLTRGQDLSPSPRHPFPASALPTAPEGSRRHE